MRVIGIIWTLYPLLGLLAFVNFQKIIKINLNKNKARICYWTCPCLLLSSICSFLFSFLVRYFCRDYFSLCAFTGLSKQVFLSLCIVGMKFSLTK